MRASKNRDSRNASFNTVEGPALQRSMLNRSFGHSTTFDGGQLIPIFLEECLPGDTMKLAYNFFIRLATLLHPVISNIFADVHWWAVPYRLVWENWEKLHGEKEKPDDPGFENYLVPFVDAPDTGIGYASGSLADYFGIPIRIPALDHSALPMRCYNLIWNEWYRDEALQDPVDFFTDDGPDPNASYTVLKRGRRKDYFTSARPWPQAGADVLLPLGTDAPVTITSSGDGRPSFNQDGFSGTGLPTTLDFTGSPHNIQATNALSGTGLGTNPMKWEDPKLQGTADLTAATAASINLIREAFQFQRILERDARSGTRYAEHLRSHWGVTPDDLRLMRPEYLGGTTIPIITKAVEATAEAGTRTPGDLAGYGVGAKQGRQFIKSFNEHTFVLGLISVRCDLVYQQGLHKMWSRRSRFDHYLPGLAHLGEQEILNKEIYAQGAEASPDNTIDDQVFGYQERWGEYKYRQNMVTGKLRSTVLTGTLDSWHTALKFDSLPVLGATFVEEDPPFDRIVATPDEPHFLCDAWFDYNMARPMPVHSTPGLVDHF